MVFLPWDGLVGMDKGEPLDTLFGIASGVPNAIVDTDDPLLRDRSRASENGIPGSSVEVPAGASREKANCEGPGAGIGFSGPVGAIVA